ncbi:MFS transporter [Candidatus Lokiarchaeum ossiferum]
MITALTSKSLTKIPIIKSPETEKKFDSVFLGLSSFQFLAMFRRGIFYTYLSIYLRNYLGLSVTATTLFVTIPMLFSAIFQTFIWGRLSDRLQKRRTLIIAGEIFAGILILSLYILHAFQTNLVLAGYIIIGGLTITEIFWSMSNIGWTALLSDLYPQKERSTILGRITTLSGVGRMIGVFFGGYLYNGFGKFYKGWGFREGSMFYITVIFIFISIIPMRFLVPEGGINYKQTFSDPKLNQQESNSSRSLSSKEKKIFTTFLISLLLINLGRNSIFAIFSQFLVLESGFNCSSQLLSYIMNTQSLAVVLTGFMAGILSKKFGDSLTLIMATLMLIGFMLITAFTTQVVLIFVGSFLWGSSYVLLSTASYGYVAKLIPETKRGKLFAYYNMAFFLSSGLAGTIITGPLVDRLISEGTLEVEAYRLAFVIGTIISTIGFGVFLGLEIWRGKKNETKNWHH